MSVRSTIAIALVCLLVLAGVAGAEDAYPLDLTKAVNLAFQDDVAGDGVGGWTDQGGNDFRHMPVGEQTLCGVPFRIVDPAKNAGKACLVLRGHGRRDLPEAAKVPVGRKGGAIVFLHALAWGDEQPAAHYIVAYADGKTEDIPIRSGKEILGWWGAQETDDVKIAVLSGNLATRTIAVHAWAWKNPRPDAAIESVEFRSAGGAGMPIIVAATLLPRVPVLRSQGRKPAGPGEGFVLIEAENFAAFNVPPWKEPSREEAAKGHKDKAYDTWSDPRFSGGCVFQIKASPQLAHVAGGEKPAWLQEGVIKIDYRFAADKADPYVFWARVGPANVYSPFRWRVDDGEWGKITHQDPFLDMWEMGFWATMGWVRLGERRLAGGPHVLHIEVPRPDAAGQTPDHQIENLMDEAMGRGDGNAPVGKRGSRGKAPAKAEAPPWGVMADCFVATRVPFHPNGILKPGEEINRVPWLDAPARSAILYLGDEKIAADATRQRFWLDGLWEMARDQEPIPSPVAKDEDKLRGPLVALPDPNTLAWMGVNVPHTEDRPETGLLHRRWYRKLVTLPRDLHGKHVSIGFSEVNYLASVFVNGKLCGTHAGGYVPFALDITAAIKPGDVNEILVGVKGLAYLRKQYLPEGPWGFSAIFWRAMLAPGRTGWGGDRPTGIPGSAWLETHGAIAGHDVFVQSKFADKQVLPSVEVDNRGGAAFTGTVKFSVREPKTGELVAEVGQAPLQLAAGKTAVVSAAGSAERVEPWWPERPRLYTIRAEILGSDGKAVDCLEDSFGYREVTLKDKCIYVNGTRFNFRSVLAGGKDTLEESLAHWRAMNCNTIRLPDVGFNRFFHRDPQRELLRWADGLGIAVRYCSQINGMSIDVATDDERFWKYSTDYYRQFIKAYRNHPSILVWTAENELDLISNMGNDKEFKRREWAMIRTAHEIDPSRPVMGDGAGDLLGECEMCNWHYCEVGPIVDPADAKTLAERGKEGVGAVYPENAFTFARLPGQCSSRPWDRKRPLWAGETYFYSGPVKWQCWVGGDEALSGRLAANEASARFVNMLCRGYRWQDVAGFNIFAGADQIPGPEIRRSLAPVAVFCRDYDRNHFAGETFERRLKVFNDTLDEGPITLDWDLTVGGKAAVAGHSEHTIAAGQNGEVAIQVKAPPALDRADGFLRLRLSRGGKTVFEEDHPVSILAKLTDLPLAKGSEVRLYDPSQKVGPVLEGWKVGFQKLGSLDGLGGSAGLLIVGPDAMKAGGQAAWGKLTRFVEAGGRALVLEQNGPLPAKALPLPIEAQQAEGSTAFPRGTHPTLAGVQREDLCLWGRDQAVYRWPFARSPKWPLLVDASTKDAMNLAPVVETTWGKGRLVLCQLLVGEKLVTEPMAERMLANFIRYLAPAPAKGARLECFADKNAVFSLLMKDLGFAHTLSPLSRGDIRLDVALRGKADVVLLPGARAALGELASLQKPLGEFTARGGWVLLQDLEPGATELLSRLVGEELLYRPGRQERITVVGREDPLMTGIGSHEFYWEQRMDDEAAEKAHFLFGDRPLRDDVFSGVIVYDDVCSLTGNVALSNGLTSDDHWRYIQYAGDDPIRLDWGRAMPIHQVVVRENRHYKRMEEITLRLGEGPADALRVEVPKDRQRHVFDFPPRELRSLSLQATKFVKVAGDGPMGWDTVEIYRTLSDSFRTGVVPLTRPAGIVKFPMGKGGILLNTTSLKDPRGIRVLMQLLHNLGVPRGAAVEEDGLPLEPRDNKDGKDRIAPLPDLGL